MLSIQELKSISYAQAVVQVRAACENSGNPDLRNIRDTAALISFVNDKYPDQPMGIASLMALCLDYGLAGDEKPAASPAPAPVAAAVPPSQPVPQQAQPAPVQAPAPAAPAVSTVAAPTETLVDYLARKGFTLGVSEKGLPMLNDGTYVCKYCLVTRDNEPYVAAETQGLGGHARKHDVKELKSAPAMQELAAFLSSAPTFAAKPAAPAQAEPQVVQHTTEPAAAAAPAAEAEQRPSLGDIFTQHRTLEAVEDKNRDEIAMHAQLDAMMANLDASITGKLAEVLRVLNNRIDVLETNLAQMQLVIGNMSVEDKGRMFQAYAQPRINELGSILGRKV